MFQHVCLCVCVCVCDCSDLTGQPQALSPFRIIHTRTKLSHTGTSVRMIDRMNFKLDEKRENLDTDREFRRERGLYGGMYCTSCQNTITISIGYT